MKLKLCGLRLPQDVEIVNEASPDYIGFIFAPSKRYIEPSRAAELGRGLEKDIKKVGVFVNEAAASVLQTAETAGLDVIQLHGDEDGEYIRLLRQAFTGEIWKAVRVRSSADVKAAEALPADMLLYDSFVKGEYGGSGKRADLNAITAANPSRPFFLAGGINAENIDRILNAVTPYGLDISSGFETGGVKDRAKLQNIMNALKGRI